ncbi:MAG: sulfatase [Planctomycetota bacterium]
MMMLSKLSFWFVLMGLFACLSCSNNVEASPPNMIMFIADDISWNDFGCYGNPAARTPHIDQLAREGIRFDRAFLTASSCSPSRSSIITGRYPHNNGKAAELHAPISSHLPWFPELLREAGYYTAISGKHHMKAVDPDVRPPAFEHVDGGKVKGDTSGAANWLSVTKDRPRQRPFFFWFASYDAHRVWDGDQQWKTEYGPQHDWRDVVVPPFLVDDEVTRRDLASYYNEVTRFDFKIGEIISELRRQRVLDDTLVLILADNGRPFPRAKTRLHDSGMKTAMVAHWPNGLAWNGTSNQLVSVIDLAPTFLSVAGCPLPKTLQGVSMQPLFRESDASIRRFAFSEHNWHDYEAHGRSIRDGEFLFIRNGRPQFAWQGPADSVRSDSHRQLLNARSAGTLAPAQEDVFRAPRPSSELYRLTEDPFQLMNLAGQDQYRDVEERLAATLAMWIDQTADSLPEQLTPDTFDRTTGKRLAKRGAMPKGTLTPGEDRGADRVHHPGPR